MIKDAAYREALSSATEDSTGLWEFEWWVQTEFPELPEHERRQIAVHVLSQLISEGLIELIWIHPEQDREVVLPQSQSLEALDRAEEWFPPHHPEAEHIEFVATEAGERRYFGNTVNA